jgi:hypothetical protein
MPLFTPSRLAIIIVSFSLITFFWTFGAPLQTAQPAVPVIDHYDHKNVHSEPIIPPPVIEATHATAKPTPHGDRPAETTDHSWDDKAKQSGKGQAAAPAPTETGVAEFEKDGGRWEDKDKLKEGGKSGKILDGGAAVVPTTLLTEAKPTPSDANAVNATETSAVEAAPTHAVQQFCKDFDGAQDVMVILRTSKAEFEKVSTHLHGLLSCVPTFAIFSDHAGEFEGHKIHNALDTIGHDAKAKHNEFKEYQIMHADAEHKPDPKKTKDLDKWKFLPMVYKAYHMNPSARFFVFIEADTSLSWTNLLQWVNRLDYRIPYYSGAPAFISETKIAQRGPGIMLSQGAMRRYTKSYDEVYASKWEKQVGDECCGDLMLARALGEAHVEFYASWPLLQSERPNTLDFTKKHWCVPAVSWHHQNGEHMTAQWELEKKWTEKHGWKKPYLYRDAFQDHFAPHLEVKKENWDNLSEDTKIIAPQGRQQQLKEEADRSKQHEDDQEKKKGEDTSEQGEESHDTSREKSKPDHENILQDDGSSAPTSPQSRRADNKEDKKGDKKEDHKPELDWDKLAEKFGNAADSPRHCDIACEAVEDCLQWRYSTKGDGECHLSKVLLGSASEKKEGERWTSGWLVERVKETTEGWACKKVEWKFYQ